MTGAERQRKYVAKKRAEARYPITTKAINEMKEFHEKILREAQ